MEQRYKLTIAYDGTHYVGWQHQKNGVSIQEIETRLSDDAEGFVEILVSDNGCGIPEDIAARVFDPFYTTKDVGKGTGLGLSISYGIIKDHKGTIEVTQTGPEGSTFLTRLPVV